MIASLTLVLLAQLLGEGLARGAGMSVPGLVLGMALMLVFLVLRDRRALRLARVLPMPLTSGALETTARGLLANLSLMFVPASSAASTWCRRKGYGSPSSSWSRRPSCLSPPSPTPPRRSAGCRR